MILTLTSSGISRGFRTFVVVFRSSEVVESEAAVSGAVGGTVEAGSRSPSCFSTVDSGVEGAEEVSGGTILAADSATAGSGRSLTILSAALRKT